MDSSSISSHHYAALLQTITDLRADLEKTTARIRSLEDQNETLNVSYSAVKDELFETRKKYNEAREGYLNSVAEKFEAERQHEVFMERLKLQLLDRTREFEQIKEKLVPHDIDQLRIQVQEEMQLQHKQELKAKDNEVESYKDKCFSIKRELERTRGEYMLLLEHQKKEIEALRQDNMQLTDLMPMLEPINLSHLSASSGNNREDVSPHTLREEKQQLLQELDFLRNKMREELTFERDEKIKANHAAEKLNRDLEHTLMEMREQVSMKDAEMSGLNKRLAKLQEKLERKQSQLKHSRQLQEELENASADMGKEITELKRLLSATRAETGRQLDEHRAEASKRWDTLHEELEATKLKLKDREDCIKRMQHDVSDLQHFHETADHDLRKMHVSQTQEVRRKNHALELENVELRSQMRHREEDWQAKCEHITTERDVLMSEMTRARREKEILHLKLREQDVLQETQRKKWQSIQSELLQKISDLERQLRDTKTAVHTSEIRVENMAARLKDHERERQRLADEVHSQEIKYQDLKKAKENMHREFQQQLESLAPSYKEKSEEMASKMKMALNKEKKRADAYKAKALEAHMRVKSLSEAALAQQPQNF